MRGSPEEPPEAWRDECAMLFMGVRLHNPEPEEWFDEWIAQQEVHDDPYMHYAFKTWREISSWNATELTLRREQLYRLMRDSRNPNYRPPYER